MELIMKVIRQIFYSFNLCRNVYLDIGRQELEEFDSKVHSLYSEYSFDPLIV